MDNLPSSWPVRFKLLAIALAFGALLGAPIAQAAGPMDVLETRYRLGVNSTQGRITTCGVIYGAVLTDGARTFVVRGTIGTSFFEGRMPGFIVKAELDEVLPPDNIRRPLSFMYFKTSSMSTVGSGILFEGENGAYLAGTMEFPEGGTMLDMTVEFLTKGGLLGISFEEGQDATAYLPAPEDPNLATQVIECSSEAARQVLKELDAE